MVVFLIILSVGALIFGRHAIRPLPGLGELFFRNEEGELRLGVAGMVQGTSIRRMKRR